MKNALHLAVREGCRGRSQARDRWVWRGSLALLVAGVAIACKSTDAPPAAPAATAGAEAARTPATAQPDVPRAASGEWENLLPPASLAGYRRVPIDPLANKAVWQVRPDGVLFIDGAGAKEMLLSERELGDGRLQVEWRFLPVQPATPGAAPVYNGGVYVRTPLDGKSWVQLQVARADKPPVVGDLIAQVPGKAERVDVFQASSGMPASPGAPSPNTQPSSAQPPVGEWVRYEVLMRGRHIELSVDGKPTVAWEECPMLTGHVGLQAEGAPIEVRTLRYQPL